MKKIHTWYPSLLKARLLASMVTSLRGAESTQRVAFEVTFDETKVDPYTFNTFFEKISEENRRVGIVAESLVNAFFFSARYRKNHYFVIIEEKQLIDSKHAALGSLTLAYIGQKLLEEIFPDTYEQEFHFTQNAQSKTMPKGGDTAAFLKLRSYPTINEALRQGEEWEDLTPLESHNPQNFYVIRLRKKTDIIFPGGNSDPTLLPSQQLYGPILTITAWLAIHYFINTFHRPKSEKVREEDDERFDNVDEEIMETSGKGEEM